MVNRNRRLAMGPARDPRWRTWRRTAELTQAPALNGRRFTFTSLAAAAVGAWLVMSALAPALAVSVPSIAESSQGVNIAVEGANGSLKFYWAVNNTSAWHAETVARAGSIRSAPSIGESSQGVNIAAEGPNG